MSDSDQVVTQHATRREWWLAQSMDRVMPRAYFSSEKTARYIEQDTPCEFIHVREVRPEDMEVYEWAREALQLLNAMVETIPLFHLENLPFGYRGIIERCPVDLPEGQEVGK